MTEYSTEDILGMHADRLDAIERRVLRLEQTVRAHAVVSDARWARPAAVASVPGRVSMTFTTLKTEKD